MGSGVDMAYVVELERVEELGVVPVAEQVMVVDLGVE